MAEITDRRPKAGTMVDVQIENKEWFTKIKIVTKIENGEYFHVKRTKVRVVNGKTCKYLRTDGDDTESDNLGDL